jgi:hypothetical protein
VRHIILLCLRESVPRISEFVGELDFPWHIHSMPYTEYPGRQCCYAAVMPSSEKKTVLQPRNPVLSLQQEL